MIAGHPAAHKEGHYRCFLPDLAGFVILCCAGPGYQTEIIDGREGRESAFAMKRLEVTSENSRKNHSCRLFKNTDRIRFPHFALPLYPVSFSQSRIFILQECQGKGKWMVNLAPPDLDVPILMVP